MRKDASGGKLLPLPSSLDECSESPWVKCAGKGNLVGKRARKRPNRRYGAGQGGGHDTLGPFISTAHSKTPGRKNSPAIPNAPTSSPPAPHCRFARIRTEKTTTCRRETQKGRLDQETTRREPRRAHQNPDMQTPKGTRQSSDWIGTNLRPLFQIGKKRQGGRLVRVEPNCDALDKLCGIQVRRGIIQAES